MVWSFPTPQETLQRTQAQMDTELKNGDSRVRWSVESVMAKVIAMAVQEILTFVKNVARNILTSTADEEHLPRHASEWGITRKPATAATGSVTFTGTNGAIIPAGRILKRSDDREFVLAADVTITAGTGTGLVTATSSGAAGNAPAATKLSLTSPAAGVSSEAVVSAPGITGGNDIEDVEAWRGRILERKRRPPHGGDADDYVIWVKQVPGVTRAWPFPNRYGRGTVGVAIVMDNKIGTIIPSPTEVAITQAHINSVRPVTAEVTVFAPTAVPLNFTINISPNTLATREAIKAELADLITREAIPGGTLYLSRIREAISVAAGEFDNVLVSPSANVVSGFGQLTTLGSITFGGI